MQDRFHYVHFCLTLAEWAHGMDAGITGVTSQNVARIHFGGLPTGPSHITP